MWEVCREMVDATTSAVIGVAIALFIVAIVWSWVIKE